MTIRELALKLFAKVYGVRTATTYLVKKQFPKFRASLKDHWEFLIIKLLKIYREQKAKQQRELAKDFVKMTDSELREVALERDVNPNQPRFLLLKALGVVSEKPQLSDRHTLTSRKGKALREWNGRLSS